ncbi:protein phosphatase 2C domain-containing protein [Streptomyces lonegramiae]|uniref:Protein phosphatase 2C domain-containing protein n=1 Tax=Streptomyces lonegramiae TaxID=3075524 RepID=A0ABU2XB49_9ACTN|nr:protein phosphatase 2C domain-containing protein [Streptomyces sp. DSM 41529]MDT0543136.1 protein phosphatase 2C domain-containing protein [Streptomyces sp. DSM 41529]
MSQQGDRRRHEDDWWGELYHQHTGDVGPATASDSVDDRFDSASRTVGGPPSHRAPLGSIPAAGAPWGPEPGPEPEEPTEPAPSDAAFGWFSGERAPAPAPADPRSAKRPSLPRPYVPRPPAPQPPAPQPAPDADADADEPIVPPPADPYELADLVPDTVLDGARCGAATLRAVSSRGESARRGGEPRRDVLLMARFGSGPGALVLVALAGGAGGVGGADGAHQAARELCEWIGGAVGRSHAQLVDDIRSGNRGALKSGLHRLTDRGLGRLRARAAELGLDPAEYASALRCLVLPADPDCRIRVAFGVGDGGLFRLRAGVWQDLEPAEPEPDTAGGPVLGFGSATRAAAGSPPTMDLGIATPGTGPAPGPAPVPAAAPFRFRASVARPGDVLLMCGRGLAEPLRGRPELAGHLAERWAEAAPPGLAEFLADTRTRVEGYADDRTAAAVWEA